LEGSAHSLRYYAKPTETRTRDGQCTYRGYNRGHREYKLEALLLQLLGSTVLNPLKPNRYCMYHHVYLSKILRSAQRMQLYVLCGPRNKQCLFPYTDLLTFLKPRRTVYCAVRTGYLNTSIPPTPHTHLQAAHTRMALGSDRHT